MKIVLSGILRRFAEYRDEIDVEAVSASEALDVLVDRYPSLRTPLLDGGGGLRANHLLCVDGQQLERHSYGRSLEATARLEIVTAIAGG